MSVLSAFNRRRAEARIAQRPGALVYGFLTFILVASVFPFYWSFLIGSGDAGTLSDTSMSWIPGANFFANRSGAPKPEYRQNQFGGVLGGPIRKNKTFLFGSFDGTRIRSGTSSIDSVPTAAERDGDFSKIRNIFDPMTTAGTGAASTTRTG